MASCSLKLLVLNTALYRIKMVATRYDKSIFYI